MARQPRFQNSGALYHVMARGNGGDLVFVTEDDRMVFLHRLGQACESHGWVIHAWVLMVNHFHLLLETPEPNLVSGMKWLLSAYSQGWNRARMRRGHVFQGRYKDQRQQFLDRRTALHGTPRFRQSLRFGRTLHKGNRERNAQTCKDVEMCTPTPMTKPQIYE